MATNPSKKGKADKVFDVAKPGKTAASSSSRPLIIGHKPMLKDPMVKDSAVSDMDENTPVKIDKPFEEDIPTGSPMLPIAEQGEEPEPEKTVVIAPSKSKITINPLSKLSKKEDKTEDSKSQTPKSDNELKVPIKMDEADKTPKNIVVKDTNESKDDIEASSIAPEPVDIKPAESDKSTTDTRDENPEAEKTTTSEAKSNMAHSEDDAPEEDEDSKKGASDSESDKASATAAAQQAAKTAQEEATKKEHIEKMVNSKQYVVPIGEKTRKKRSLRRILTGVLLILLLGGALVYMMIDVGIIKTSINLPYHFFKQANITDTTQPPATTTTTKPKTTPKPAAYIVPTGYTVYENKDNGFKFVYPKAYGSFSRDNNSADYQGQSDVQDIISSGLPKTAFATAVSGGFSLVIDKTKTDTFTTVKYGPTVKISNSKLVVTSDNSADPTPYKVGAVYTPYKTSTVHGVTVYTLQSVNEGGLVYEVVYVSNNKLVKLTLPEFDTGEGLGTGTAKPNDQKPYDTLYTNILNSISPV